MIILNNILYIKKYKCSITVETALAFTFMMIILFSSLGPIFMCKTSASLILDMDKLTKDFSYIKAVEWEQSTKNIDRLYDNEELKTDIDIDLSDYKDGIKNLINIAIIRQILLKDNGDNNNPFCNIKDIIPKDYEIYDEEKGLIKYDLQVTFKEPLNLFNIKDIDNRFISYRRPFIGSDGNRQGNNIATSSEAGFFTADDYKIYHIYHTYRDCFRLEKDVKKISYDEITDKYTACARCFKGINDYINYDIYITETGKKFHKDPRCSTMTAIVTERDKKFIDENALRLCDVCAKRSD